MIDLEQLTQAQKETLYRFAVEQANRSEDFSVAAGVRLTAIDARYAEGELELEPRHLNFSGIVHGGCLATLADMVAGTAASARGVPCVTLSSHLNFLASRSAGRLRCRADVERAGRNISVVRVAVTAEEGALIATGSFTFRMLPDAVPPAPIREALAVLRQWQG